MIIWKKYCNFAKDIKYGTGNKYRRSTEQAEDGVQQD